MLENRKLAGVLPRMRWRGSRLMGFSVGVGLNGFNRVPAGAINLAEGLRLARPRLLVHPQCHPDRLAALVLRALEWAVSASDNAELVRRQAEQRLWRSGPHWHEGQSWQVVGLSIDGGLRLRDGQRLVELRRHF
jgi:BirA family biotin operon repressor/biotin-[acetyl-CoA-carboxylase] ligase